MKTQRGFTLIELIVVIVLIGILSVGAGLLITRPIEAYNDQLRRHQLVDSAEMALRKIATDIRRAVPNSIRIIDNSPNGWALEMMNSLDGARYRDESGAAFNSAGDILQFTGVDTAFNILGALPELATGVVHSGLRVVVYNTNASALYADAFNNSNPGVISLAGLRIDANGVEQRVTLSNAFQFAFRSPGQRLFIVDGPISYICNAATGALTRFSDYPDQLVQIGAAVGFPPGAASGRVASQVATCNIDYQPGTPQRGGLITLELGLRDSAGEQLRLLHQVHVDNVP